MAEAKCLERQNKGLKFAPSLHELGQATCSLYLTPAPVGVLQHQLLQSRDYLGISDFIFFKDTISRPQGWRQEKLEKGNIKAQPPQSK